MNISKRDFGETSDGRAVSLYVITNDNGMEVAITDFGATVVSLKVPDRRGKIADVVLGFNSLDPYLENSAYLGCIVGRVANRIANARFTLEGKEYKLAANNGPNHLHGGVAGFHRQLWKAEEFCRDNEAGLELSLTSPDGEEGYPGNLICSADYTFSNDGSLRIDYFAQSDMTTVINLTNHSYFNLAGEGAGDILGHELFIDADRITPNDITSVPVGEFSAVKGTPMDFTEPKAIGFEIEADYEQLKIGNGYDHNYVINGYDGSLRTVAEVVEPESGRRLEVMTTQPGIQLYTGNYLDGTLIGKSGRSYVRRSGFCLETQHFPDAPNQPGFPSIVLEPGEQYSQATVFVFSND